MKVKGITTCVGYDDLLAITLPHNRQFMDESYVVTDVATSFAVRAIAPDSVVLATDLFTRNGEHSNKGAALEAGFGIMDIQPTDWILIWDADTLFPPDMRLRGLNPQYLHGAKRRLLYDPVMLPIDWSKATKTDDSEIAGYFQLFCASVLERPWYEDNWTHAGGADSMFARRFGRRTRRLDFDVLHLGPRDTNWFGRCSPRVDGLPVACTNTLMERFLHWKGWFRPKQDIDFKEKIDVTESPE